MRFAMPIFTLLLLAGFPAGFSAGTTGDGPVTPFYIRNETWNVTANGTYQYHQNLAGVYCSITSTILVGSGPIQDHKFNASLTFGPLCAPSLEITDLAGHVMAFPLGHRVCVTQYAVTVAGTNAIGQCLDWTFQCTYEGTTCYGPTAHGDTYDGSYVIDPTWQLSDSWEGWLNRGCFWPGQAPTFPCHEVASFMHWNAWVSDFNQPSAGVCPLSNPNYPAAGHKCILWMFISPKGYDARASGECRWMEASLPPASVQRCEVVSVK